MQDGCSSLEGSLVLDLEAGLAVAAVLVVAVALAQADLPAGSHHAYSLLKYLTVHETITEMCVGWGSFCLRKAVMRMCLNAALAYLYCCLEYMEY